MARWYMNRRPQIEMELRALIRLMSTENQLWGAPRIHGELLKLGFSVAQSTVAKYMVKRRGPPSQGWKTFLRNHAPDIAATVRGPDHWLPTVANACLFLASDESKYINGVVLPVDGGLINLVKL
jgi:NAD(P)-dependent dehydrogenase (short-subunit alcohol dehydrogenase family)